MGDVTLAGLRMTAQEWDGLDEGTRLELVRLAVEPSPPRWPEDDYESYEIVFDAPM